MPDYLTVTYPRSSASTFTLPSPSEDGDTHLTAYPLSLRASVSSIGTVPGLVSASHSDSDLSPPLSPTRTSLNLVHCCCGGGGGVGEGDGDGEGRDVPQRHVQVVRASESHSHSHSHSYRQGRGHGSDSSRPLLRHMPSWASFLTHRTGAKPPSVSVGSGTVGAGAGAGIGAGTGTGTTRASARARARTRTGTGTGTGTGMGMGMGAGTGTGTVILTGRGGSGIGSRIASDTEDEIDAEQVDDGGGLSDSLSMYADADAAASEHGVLATLLLSPKKREARGRELELELELELQRARNRDRTISSKSSRKLQLQLRPSQGAGVFKRFTLAQRYHPAASPPPEAPLASRYLRPSTIDIFSPAPDEGTHQPPLYLHRTGLKGEFNIEMDGIGPARQWQPEVEQQPQDPAAVPVRVDTPLAMPSLISATGAHRQFVGLPALPEVSPPLSTEGEGDDEREPETTTAAADATADSDANTDADADADADEFFTPLPIHSAVLPAIARLGTSTHFPPPLRRRLAPPRKPSGPAGSAAVPTAAAAVIPFMSADAAQDAHGDQDPSLASLTFDLDIFSPRAPSAPVLRGLHGLTDDVPISPLALPELGPGPPPRFSSLYSPSHREPVVPPPSRQEEGGSANEGDGGKSRRESRGSVVSLFTALSSSPIQPSSVPGLPATTTGPTTAGTTVAPPRGSEDASSRRKGWDTRVVTPTKPAVAPSPRRLSAMIRPPLGPTPTPPRLLASPRSLGTPRLPSNPALLPTPPKHNLRSSPNRNPNSPDPSLSPKPKPKAYPYASAPHSALETLKSRRASRMGLISPSGSFRLSGADREAGGHPRGPCTGGAVGAEQAGDVQRMERVATPGTFGMQGEAERRLVLEGVNPYFA